MRDSVWADEEGLTLFSGVLAILSTCVGGGIVGLPFSMFHFGMPTALVLHIGVIYMT
jgi:amino acid permease